MDEVFIWHLFNQLAIGPFVFGDKTNPEILQKAQNEEIPHILDYLETQLPAEGYIFGTLSIADIAIACFFRSAAFSRYEIDATRWPKTAAFTARMFAQPSFAKLMPIEDRLIRTPPAQHRAVLGEMGVALTTETYATANPRRGLMQI